MGQCINDTEAIYKKLIDFETFENLPEHQLKWLIEKGDVMFYEVGEQIIEPGEAIDNMIIMLSGEVSIRIQQGREFRPLGRFKKGSITGLLPYSRMGKGRGYGDVKEEGMALLLHKDHFPVLIREHHELTERLVHFTFDRIRYFTTFQNQNEKLMALGKLSAGLAHELNNPASAMVRGATELKKHISYSPEKFKNVLKLQMTDQEIDSFNEVIYAKAEQGLVHLTIMERSEREDDIADWLEDNGVDNPFILNEILTDYGITTDELDALKMKMPDVNHMNAILGWAGSVLTTEKMVAEIEDASNRISGLVSSVKVHSHMDQGVDKEPVDLVKLLNSTLTILGHKVRAKNLNVEIDIPKDLPVFNGFVSELNQVWMNLLDNAIDALDHGGQIEIKADSDANAVYVMFIDNGSGIPEDVLNQIFDPFFTTKEMGKGTGLGLDVVRKIIDKHDGNISVESKPGRTEFEICLPRK